VKKTGEGETVVVKESSVERGKGDKKSKLFRAQRPVEGSKGTLNKWKMNNGRGLWEEGMFPPVTGRRLQKRRATVREGQQPREKSLNGGGERVCDGKRVHHKERKKK